jgi:hypothetical protein
MCLVDLLMQVLEKNSNKKANIALSIIYAK